MTDEKKGGEPEKTREFISNGMKKDWDAVKRFGKGEKKAFQKKKK